MAYTLIRPREIVTLKQFYELMAQTRVVRSQIVYDIFQKIPANPAAVESLENALKCMQEADWEDGLRALLLDDQDKIFIRMLYEMAELKKDLVFLRDGEAALLDYLAELHPGFKDEVTRGKDRLGGLDFNCMLSDRDGTTNNYCGRYMTSVQSVYNAVFLARFARSRVRNPLFITSAPLTNPGILDIVVTPENSFIYAASKGRECVDLQGVRHSFPIDADKQEILDAFNKRMARLLREPKYEKFTLIGSGFQPKFGQTTIARQNIRKSVTDEESLAFLERIREMVQETDPAGEHFRIEDTGLDVEVILTIEGDGGLKDFDKADAIKYLNEELGLNLATGPNLVCGDTSSDLPMVKVAMEYTDDTWAVFVTRKDDLAEMVRTACPNTLIVTEPDVLVTVLGSLA